MKDEEGTKGNQKNERAGWAEMEVTDIQKLETTRNRVGTGEGTGTGKHGAVRVPGRKATEAERGATGRQREVMGAQGRGAQGVECWRAEMGTKREGDVMLWMGSNGGTEVGEVGAVPHGR